MLIVTSSGFSACPQALVLAHFLQERLSWLRHKSCLQTIPCIPATKASAQPESWYHTYLCVQYGMASLVKYITTQLEELQFFEALTLDSSKPTYVFKWLVTADELQLDELRNICIDALGTRLLPDLHKHAATFSALQPTLHGATVARVIGATARCSNCLSAAGKQTQMCACERYWHMSTTFRKEPRMHDRYEGKVCAACKFRRQRTTHVQMAEVCDRCNGVRKWVSAADKP